jgi:hypothetical protein
MPWDLETLKTYVDTRLDAIGQRSDDRLSTIQRESDTQARDLTRRFDNVNELRELVNDQAARFITSDAYHAEHDALNSRLDTLTNRVTTIEASATGTARLFGFLVAGIGAIGAIATTIIVLTHH